MNIDILQRPAATTALVHLGSGESLTAEGGAMIAMSSDIHMETTTHQKSGSGGIMSGLKRMLSGESFFINHYTAGSQGGQVYLAPKLHGDILQLPLQGKKIIVQSGSYLASDAQVSVTFNWQGMKTILSGEGLFWLELTGDGNALVNAFGEIIPIEVNGEYIVDTGHIVAFEQGLSFSISKAGSSWLGSFLGGEGFVCRFKGQGKLWVQSHNPNAFGTKIGAKLKPR